MIEKAAHSSTYKKKRGLNSVNSKHTGPAASPAILRLLTMGVVLWSTSGGGPKLSPDWSVSFLLISVPDLSMLF